MLISQGKKVFWALREHGFFVFSRRHGSGPDDEPGEYQIWPSIYEFGQDVVCRRRILSPRGSVRRSLGFNERFRGREGN